MYGKLHSACLYGIDGVLIEVETDLSNGLPQTSIIGLPDSAIREAVERVRAAIKNCGYQYPLQRITINLAPADLRKEGSSFDLAIAIGLLMTSGQARTSSRGTDISGWRTGIGRFDQVRARHFIHGGSGQTTRLYVRAPAFG